MRSRLRLPLQWPRASGAFAAVQVNRIENSIVSDCLERISLREYKPNEKPGPDAIVDISIAHSPDSDDAFMFYGLATNKIRVPGFRFSHTLCDIETLNNKARTRLSTM